MGSLRLGAIREKADIDRPCGSFDFERGVSRERRADRDLFGQVAEAPLGQTRLFPDAPGLLPGRGFDLGGGLVGRTELLPQQLDVAPRVDRAPRRRVDDGHPHPQVLRNVRQGPFARRDVDAEPPLDEFGHRLEERHFLGALGISRAIVSAFSPTGTRSLR